MDGMQNNAATADFCKSSALSAELFELLKKRLSEKQLTLVITDKAVEAIVEKGYDPVYGARPLKRYMQHTLETMLAKSILAGGYVSGDTITVDYDTEFTIKKN